MWRPQSVPTRTSLTTRGATDGSADASPDAFADASADAEDAGALRLYDFRRPARMGNDHLRTLTAIHEILATSMSEWLSARFREPIDVTLDGLDEIAFGEITRALPKPCAVYHFSVNGTPELNAMIDLGSDLAFARSTDCWGAPRTSRSKSVPSRDSSSGWPASSPIGFASPPRPFGGITWRSASPPRASSPFRS